MLLNAVSLLLLQITLGVIGNAQPAWRGIPEHIILACSPVSNLIQADKRVEGASEDGSLGASHGDSLSREREGWGLPVLADPLAAKR